MGFVNLYFGLKLLPVIIIGFCVLVFVLWVAWILMIEKIKDCKNKLLGKFRKRL
jgi:hypothetical protein